MVCTDIGWLCREVFAGNTPNVKRCGCPCEFVTNVVALPDGPSTVCRERGREKERKHAHANA